MRSIRIHAFVAGAVLSTVAALVSLEVVAVRGTTSALGGPDRYLTTVTTDKPVYRPGERVYVRGVVLHAFDRTPLPKGQETQVTVEVKGPKGETVATGHASSQNSVWAFAWEVPEGQAGGEYKLKATYPWTGHAPAERKFDVRVYRAPRLKSQIVFLRDGYGPGDEVTATLDVKRAEGGVPEGAKVTATARLDGVEVARVPSRVDSQGLCTVSFPLPKTIARGDGSLAFAIEDGGVVETAAKTIPILLQTVDLSLYPEGGDLVAGLKTRVYFEARTPVGKPGDIAGAIVDGAGKQVATFRSEHEGRGRFELTPKKGATYTLRIDEPAGITTTYPLPAVKPQGAAVRAAQDVVPAGKPVQLLVGSNVGKPVRVTLSHREVELASKKVAPSRGTRVVLDPKGAEGVLVATVWDAAGKPLAERLVFRRPSAPLNIAISADRDRYVPGGQVKLTVKTTRRGKPVPAYVGITVTDDSVLEMIEKREQAPRLPVMVYLEPEVKELADAHVYLDPKNPDAPLAVDLLLGTQGWRRFAWMDTASLIAQHGDNARRVFALRIQSQVEVTESMALRGAGRPDRVRRRGRVPQAAVPMAAPPPMAPDEPEPAPPPGADAPEGRPVERPAARPVVAQPPPPRDRKLPAGPRSGKDMNALQEALAASAEAEQRELVIGGEELRESRQQAQQMVLVREYAHQVREDRKPTDRIDFTETLFWNAGIQTNAGGKATVKFGLNDSVTSFRATAEGFTVKGGSLGAGTALVEAVQPFYLEPKLPLAVTAGDVVQLPVAVVNGTSKRLRGVEVNARTVKSIEVAEVKGLDLRPDERGRRIMELRIGDETGEVDFELRGRAGPFADNVTRKLKLEPKGFPFEVAFGGVVGPRTPAVHTVTIPEDLVPYSMETKVEVYPTPLANLTAALERLIVDPSGCFEQTSSTSYPLTMAQQYFMSHSGVDPELVKRAKEKLDKGYQRLVGFECAEKGYEWFGQDPGHEALTAYGLLHFTDMAEVREVDSQMLDRTRAWLMKQRDGKGGFARKRRALHTWIEDPDTSNAYITWALLESGGKGLEDEVASLEKAALASKNSYVAALAGNVMALAGKKAAAKKLNDRLMAKQDKDGSVGGGTQSIVGSGGQALTIETTALAALSWMRDPAYAGAVEKSMRYLADNCEGGRYGSTQSTVLALRAIVTYDKMRARPKRSGAVRVYVDGQAVGSAVKFDTDTKGPIQLPAIYELLDPGTHKVELRMTDGGEMPYSIAITYNALRADTSPEVQVSLGVELTKSRIDEGELLEAIATVRNTTGEKLATIVAIIGLPGGIEPRHDQLKELKKKGTIDSYEVIGREVVLYWRGMKPRQTVRVPLSLLAAVPGTYTGPASRAYLYYTDEYKHWTDPLAVTIRPKGG